MIDGLDTKHETVSADGKKATPAIPPGGLPDQKTESFAARPTKHVQPSGLRTTGACSISEPLRKQKAGRPRAAAARFVRLLQQASRRSAEFDQRCSNSDRRRVGPLGLRAVVLTRPVGQRQGRIAEARHHGECVLKNY